MEMLKMMIVSVITSGVVSVIMMNFHIKKVDESLKSLIKKQTELHALHELQKEIFLNK